MNKHQAKVIARSGITWGQVHAMLDRAHQSGAATDTRQSRVNKSLTKAQAFDILDSRGEYDADRLVRSGADRLIACNCLWEYGEFWI